MTTERIIWIATWAFDKGYDYETVMYSDFLYGQPDPVCDEVWDYVIELKEIGKNQFYKKYKEFKLY